MTTCLRLILCLSIMVLAAGCAAQGGPRALSTLEAKDSFKQGEAAYEMGRYQDSHEAFMAAGEAGYQPGPSLVNAGAALLAMSQSSQALPQLERATREYPASAAAWYNYGLALYGTGSFDEAVLALRRSIEIDQANADVWTALGVVFVARRQPGVAVEQFDRALELDPGNTTILAGRAGAELDASLHAEAERDYRAVIAMGKDTLSGHMGLGEVYLAQEKCSQALEQFDLAVNLSPDNSLAYYNRGITQRMCGDYARATDDFSRALAFDPGWSEALVMRGDTRLQLHEADLGCKDLEAACAMGNCDRFKAVRDANFCPR